MNCICGKELKGKQTKYCSIICKRSTNNFKHQNYTAQKARGIKRKLELIIKLGGCCISCGYKKNIAALEFHHRDPNEKDFQIDVRQFSNTKTSIILAELSKCDLLCANCHREIHNESLSHLL